MTGGSKKLLSRFPILYWLARLLVRSVIIRRVPNPNARQIMITLSWPIFKSDDCSDVKSLSLHPQRGRQIKLNVGGGKGHPAMADWTVVDLREGSADIVLDVTNEPLPFDNDSVDVIFTSHTLEHIYPQRLGFVLKEFFRVLKPESGILRISVPDIELAIDAYSKKDFAFFENSHVASFDSTAPIGGLLASWFYSTRVFTSGALNYGEGHVHCFDYDYLESWLKRCGFSKVWRSGFLQSAHPELRSDALDVRPQDSLFVEATK